TKDISDIIRGIQAETAEAVSATREGVAAVQAGQSLAHNAGQALHRIMGAVSETRMLADEALFAANDQVRSSDQVVEAVGFMATLTHQISQATAEQQRGAEQIVNATNGLERGIREATRATEAIAHAAEDLRGRAGGLLTAVEAFEGEEALT
ncbi:MAG: hypothetical protein ACK46X_21720, partial [Candidatus Sericytochromatia bacterium]